MLYLCNSNWKLKRKGIENKVILEIINYVKGKIYRMCGR